MVDNKSIQRRWGLQLIVQSQRIAVVMMLRVPAGMYVIRDGNAHRFILATFTPPSIQITR